MYLSFSRSIVAVLVALSASLVFAQQAEHPGVQLYKEAKYSQAVSALKHAVKDPQYKSNATIWNYLGLALMKTGETKESKKAHETAIKFAPENSAFRTNLAVVYMLERNTDKAQAELARAIALDPKNLIAYYWRGTARVIEGSLDAAEADAKLVATAAPNEPLVYTLLSKIEVARFERGLANGDSMSVGRQIGYLTAARDHLKKCSEICGAGPAKESVEDELDSIQVLIEHFSSPRPEPGRAPEPGVTPYKIISKTFARYTRAARDANITGKIRVAVLLGADSRVRYVVLLNRLGYGLDEEAVMAARGIKFQPKMKDGKPVAAVVMFEYGFDIY